MEDKKGRWSGRNREKDVLREDVWRALEDRGVSIGEIWSRIPDFAGARAAADRLAQLPEWKAAKVVKANPDPGQAWVRLRALQDGKVVYTPVPELVKDFPFVRLEAADLGRRGIPPEAVMYSHDFIRRGVAVQFEEIPPLDFVVVGCVAVSTEGGRTGKGGGFADLELGIFRELGLVSGRTPIATTVHSFQIVNPERIPIDSHDSILTAIATPDEVIRVESNHPQPSGVAWDLVQPDQFRDIPILARLRQSLERADHGRAAEPESADGLGGVAAS